MINIAITGANGRMCQMLVQAIKESSGFNLSAKLHRQDISNGLQNIDSDIDVLVDFSHPQATLQLLPICCQRQYRMVIGTTGFSDEEKQEIIKASNHIPIILAPNMSVGVNISYKLLEFAAKILKDQSPDLAIFEIHHKHKKDIPSGTALTMGELIASAQNKSVQDAGINFSALRLGDAIGEHTAIFALEGERIEISHKCTNRALYAKGALNAANWLIEKSVGLYDMLDVLGLK